MINKYTDFLFEKLKIELIEEATIYGSSSFILKLKEISKVGGKVGEIATYILDLIQDQECVNDVEARQNFFDLTDKDDTVSFLQYSKVPDSWDEDDDPSLPYTIEGRNEMRIGRVVKSLCSMSSFIRSGHKEPSEKDIEDFVNYFKATKGNEFIKFRLVKGSDIAKYYNECKYYDDSCGSLGQSCMSCEDEEIFDIYSENTSQVNLLIYVDVNDKIHGRALVWKLDKSPCDAKYFMDRVYTNRDSDVLKFKKFAENEGWMYKKYMSYDNSNNVSFVYKGKEVYGEVIVNLNKVDFEYYPFIDTMCFINSKNETVSNLPDLNDELAQSTFGDKDTCNTCDGKILLPQTTKDKLLKRRRLCDECGNGHIKLKTLGIETKWNQLSS